MPHVITQRCCNDAACVPVCPVDCIRPRPDDPEFTTAEMLYIDPKSCIDCGLCMAECPVGAIYPDKDLPAQLAPFEAVNSTYFEDRPLRPRTPLLPPGRVYDDLGPLRVAVIGAGAAAAYAVQELIGRYAVEVDIFEKLPTPWGLVRSGVAPDHSQTKDVTKSFTAVNDHASVRMHLNVEIGTHVSMDELRSAYHAVIVATGASVDKRLGIEGEDLPGSYAASDFVGWFNGHPGHADNGYDLSGERAVIVGNGNVALDIARVLTADIDYLAATDIADHALEALRHSNIREVIVLGRRGPAQAAYTVTEFLALNSVPGVSVVIDPAEALLDPLSVAQLDDPATDPAVRMKMAATAEFAATPVPSNGKRITFRYLASPLRIEGEYRVDGLTVVRNELVEDRGRIAARATTDIDTIDTSLVLRSVGYRGVSLPGVPFDDRASVVPNIDGRIVDPAGQPIAGLYTTGWIKRGSSGGIGSNKYCARETVSALIADFQSNRLPQPATTRDGIEESLRQRRPEALTRTEWGAIDRAEIARGTECGRPRVKFTSITELVTTGKKQP